MSDKIKENEKIETKNLESIPGENDLPDVKSKEYYENLVTERRMNSYEMRVQDAVSNEATQEVSAEDLDGVAGGRMSHGKWEEELRKTSLIPPARFLEKYGGPDIYRPIKPFITAKKYGGPDMYRPRKPLTPEEQKKLEEERKKGELVKLTKTIRIDN